MNAVTQAIDDLPTDDIRDSADVEGPEPLVAPAATTMPVATTMEDILSDTEHAVEDILKSASTTVGALKKALVGARTGQIRSLRKALLAAQQATSALAEQTRDLYEGFDFDEQTYLASGSYTKELMAVAETRGVAMFEDDNLILCYPSLVRVNSADAAVEIDKTKDRKLRPSVLITQLARNQDKTPRFKVEAFLDALRSAYELLVIKDNKKADGVIKLVDIWQVLTYLPQGTKYSKQEFARDLYLLDQSGITTTPRSDRQVNLSASTGTKGTGVLVTVSRSGQQQRYWGISFTTTDDQADEV